MIDLKRNKKKKKKKNQEKEIISKITTLESNMNENNIEELDKLKTELYDIGQEKLKGSIVRSRAEYIDKGEKTY